MSALRVHQETQTIKCLFNFFSISFFKKLRLNCNKLQKPRLDTQSNPNVGNMWLEGQIWPFDKNHLALSVFKLKRKQFFNKLLKTCILLLKLNNVQVKHLEEIH